MHADNREANPTADLTKHASIYIDHAPFEHSEAIRKHSFETLYSLIKYDVNKSTENTRYWVKLPPVSSLLNHSAYRYLDFAVFERIILYQPNGEKMEEIGRLGGLYKSHTQQLSPHFTLFPIAKLNHKKEIYAQLSTGYKTNDKINAIKITAYTNDAIQLLYPQSSHANTKGLIQAGLIFYLMILAIGALLLSISTANLKYLTLAGMCLTFIVFFTRNLEPYYSTPIIWGHWDESVIKWENLCRVGMSISFVLFILVNFKLGPYKRWIYLSTALVAMMGIALGIYSSSFVGPFVHVSTSLDRLLSLEICLSITNSCLILYLVWRYNDGLFGKPFVYATLLLLIASYASLKLHSTWLGNLDSIFSSKMYATYAIIMYLTGLSYLSVKYFARREKQILLTAQENDHLQKINQAKSKLFADISHEFRTPLTIIQGLTEEVPIDPKQKDTIKRNSINLLRLVDELRDLSLLESSQIKLNYTQGDFVSYIEYLVESLHSLAEQKNIRLSIQADSDSLYMDYDENRIRQIITNLITNAIHFTPEYGDVSVMITASERTCICSVSDNGVGISEADRGKIFQRYYSNHTHATGSYTGTGIGLSLVEDLISLMDGKINVISALGEGSKFVITLPIRNEAAISEQSYHKGNHLTDTIDQVTLQYSPTDLVILIVEDNPDISQYIEDCLSDQYKILKAAHGRSGYKLAIQYIPDIIISDLMMPVMDGMELVKQIRSDQKTSHIPVIMLTAKAAQEDRESALSCGADTYLTKPFSKNELRIRINNIIQRTQLLQAKYGDGSIVPRRDSPEWLSQLHDMIRSELHEELNTDYICKKLYMSRSQLHRKLKAITGQSISAYIKKIRMQKANQLLTSTDQSIVQIAHSIGYKNAGHFATDYKKQFGKSPSEIR